MNNYMLCSFYISKFIGSKNCVKIENDTFIGEDIDGNNINKLYILPAIFSTAVYFPNLMGKLLKIWWSFSRFLVENILTGNFAVNLHILMRQQL